MVLEHGLDRVAQQGSVVARQGRDHQHRWLVFELRQGVGIICKPLEPAKLAKRFVKFNAFMNRQADTFLVNFHLMNVERWLFVILAEPIHEAVGC